MAEAETNFRQLDLFMLKTIVDDVRKLQNDSEFNRSIVLPLTPNRIDALERIHAIAMKSSNGQ